MFNILKFSLISIVFFITLPSSAKVGMKSISYKSKWGKHTGVLYKQLGINKKRPGILLLPEWWGLNKDIKYKAQSLAEKGYIVFVADLYSKQAHTNHPKKAEALIESIQGKNEKKARQSFMSALLVLKSQKQVLMDKIAVIGFGFGGSLATDMAQRGIPMTVLINFYGPIRTLKKIKPGSIHPKILWLKGDDDAFISSSSEIIFREEMEKASIPFKVINYKKTFHGFTNPESTSIGKKHRFFIQYNEASSNKAWNEMLSYLKKYLS